MVDKDTLAEFFGWCSVVNVAVLAVSAILLAILRNPISYLHAKMFGVSQTDLQSTYFQYLGNYKIAIFVLNIVPYLALKIMHKDQWE